MQRPKTFGSFEIVNLLDVLIAICPYKRILTYNEAALFKINSAASGVTCIDNEGNWKLLVNITNVAKQQLQRIYVICILLLTVFDCMKLFPKLQSHSNYRCTPEKQGNNK